MKAPLAFLPKLKLGKILASFDFILFSLFSFILFAFFLLKHFIALKNSTSPLLTLERTSLCGSTCTKNARDIKKSLSLQPAELYYILLVFLC